MLEPMRLSDIPVFSMRSAYADKNQWPKVGGDPWHFKPEAHESMVRLHMAATNYLDFYDHIRLMWKGGDLHNHGADSPVYRRQYVLNRFAERGCPAVVATPIPATVVSAQHLETQKDLRNLADLAVAENQTDNWKDRIADRAKANLQQEKDQQAILEAKSRAMKSAGRPVTRLGLPVIQRPAHSQASGSSGSVTVGKTQNVIKAE